MKSITFEDFIAYHRDSITKYNDWLEVHKDLIEFRNKANIKVFTKLFEDSRTAERLYGLLVMYNHDVIKFMDSCLTTEQYKHLMVNIMENKSYLYS